jgi:hypothetical protein
MMVCFGGVEGGGIGVRDCVMADHTILDTRTVLDVQNNHGRWEGRTAYFFCVSWGCAGMAFTG